MSKAGKQWRVAKYDGVNMVWERVFPLYRFTSLQISELLKQLAATDLTAEEVINSADPSLDTSLLGIRHEGTTQSCGENPHYTATIIFSE